MVYTWGVVDEAGIRRRYETLGGAVDERVRRLFVATESLAIGRGGQVAVAHATGVSRTTIQQGIRELQRPELRAVKGRIRRPGGGRKSAVVLDPTLRDDLERLVEPTSRGDPESPLRWTLKSVRKLAAELTIAIAAAGVGRDQQPSRVGIQRMAHTPPPATDALYGKCRRIVIDPHADPGLVVGQIVDPIRTDAAQFGDEEVVDEGLLRLAFGTQLTPDVLERTDQLLLFRVD